MAKVIESKVKAKAAPVVATSEPAPQPVVASVEVGDKVNASLIADALALLEATAPKADAVLRQDGPTLAEYVAAGYKAENYPPQGYAPVADRVNVNTLLTHIASQDMEQADTLRDLLGHPIKRRVDEIVHDLFGNVVKKGIL